MIQDDMQYKEDWVTPEGYNIVVTYERDSWLIIGLSSDDLPFGYEIPHVDTERDLLNLKWELKCDI